MIYLDHAATSFPIKYFAKDFPVYGNANSSHSLGIQANQVLEEARNRIKEGLGVKSGEVLFCRCATEAVGWLCRQVLINNFYYSEYEHDSVKEACISTGNPFCQKDYNGISLCYGDIYLHQHTNQLTGTVHPIESIGKRVQSTGAFFGSDITATIGHYPLPSNLDTFCDTVWFSGHKFGCEQGIGAIWLSDRLFKHLYGSEDSRNEYGLIHGTPNVSAAVAMSHALIHAVANAEQNNIRYGKLVNHMGTKLLENDILYHIHDVELTNKTHAINALYLPGFNADALVQFLSSRKIYVSPCYSACADNADYRVAESMGMSKEQASQTIRVSFGEDTTQEDIDALVKGIVEFKNLFI